MGRRCCRVLRCPSRRDKESKKSLFTPPLKDPEMLKEWEEALKKHLAPSGFPFTRKTYVCELHFKPEQLDNKFVLKMADGTTWTQEKEKIKLFPKSVPSVFPTEPRAIEVKAPKCKQTYVFDIEESSDGSESPDDGEGIQDGKEHAKDESEQEEADVLGSRKGLSETGVVKESKVVMDADGEGQIEIVFSEMADDGSDRESDGGHEEVIEVSDCETVDHSERQERSRGNASNFVDVRAIIGPPETENYVVNDKDEFSRLCRKYIETSLTKKGRPSRMDMYGLDPPIPKTEKSVYLYPTTKLDVDTLVSHIDHVKLPSKNWFYTVKAGSPAFLCWDENHVIHKKVIFAMRTLRPIVHLGDFRTSFTEIKKPNSIHEVNTIIKLVDSAERCSEASSACKGYFFPATSRGTNSCQPCKTAKVSECRDFEPFTLKLVKDSAPAILSGFHKWSFTSLGSELIFISWKKPHIPEKLYILSSDLKAQVMFGEDCPSFDQSLSPRSIEDVRFAISFLERCVKCTGVDNLDRSNRCRGYVHLKTRRMRNQTCDACADLKKKLVRALPVGGTLNRDAPARNREAKPTAMSVLTSLREDEVSSGQSSEADEEHVSLPDALDDIPLPNNRWTHALVDDCVIFQYWKDDSTVMKRVLIDHDLSVQIFVLDRSVVLEDVDCVSSVDDVVRILNIVDCLRVCEGYDNSHRKGKHCTGYVYGLEDGSEGPDTPYRCPKCVALGKRYLRFSSRKQSAVESSAQISTDYTNNPASECNDRMIESKPDDSEPSFKKIALEMPRFPHRPQSHDKPNKW